MDLYELSRRITAGDLPSRIVRAERAAADGDSYAEPNYRESVALLARLTPTAETRRELLASLIPRLAIADRARVDGRFLVVRGDLRTNKIHIGSGNILIEPNDQYLCIVPSQSAEVTPEGVFLPFEGDRVLAIILSKALMPARDTTITDSTIVHQIRR